MAVALHGVGVIWTADRRFADQAGLPEPPRRDRDGSDGDGGDPGGDDTGGGDGDGDGD
jgi:hypothetical protein